MNIWLQRPKDMKNKSSIDEIKNIWPKLSEMCELCQMLAVHMGVPHSLRSVAICPAFAVEQASVLCMDIR